MLSDITLYTLCFFSLLILLYFVTRITIQKLFDVLHRSFHHDQVSFIIISLLFFPGTLIHELSHFLMATILFLPVHEIQLIPQRQGKYIKLGHVLYEKRDVIRGILVGVAPVISGIILFWWFYNVDFFRESFWYIQILKVYLIFVISATMFSSKQDLIDIGYIIPMAIIVGIIGYIFQLNYLFFLKEPSVVAVLGDFLYSVTIYSIISLSIHIGIILIVSIFFILYERHTRTRTYP